MAVADVYDALISKRIYKRAFSHEQSIQMMATERGSHFDPDALDAMLSLAGKVTQSPVVTATRRKEVTTLESGLAEQRTCGQKEEATFRMCPEPESNRHNLAVERF